MNKNKKDNMRNHFLNFKWIYIIATVILSLIGWWIWYEYTYPCIYGHYEQYWQVIYCTDGNGGTIPCGGYWEDMFVCDCRGKR